MIRAPRLPAGCFSQPARTCRRSDSRCERRGADRRQQRRCCAAAGDGTVSRLVALRRGGNLREDRVDAAGGGVDRRGRCRRHLQSQNLVNRENIREKERASGRRPDISSDTTAARARIKPLQENVECLPLCSAVVCAPWCLAGIAHHNEPVLVPVPAETVVPLVPMSQEDRLHGPQIFGIGLLKQVCIPSRCWCRCRSPQRCRWCRRRRSA